MNQEAAKPAEKKKTTIFDLLVVGGGPGGTAAAFRARELGLKVAVIEYDDLMKRIRDYSKSKLILPNFGGGDRMRFPKGGSLIDALQFGPIDKDEMCAIWKGLYREHKIPNKVGVELTGLKRRQDGHYRVICWDHNARVEKAWLTRYVVLAIGNGVPRRFDIPGNTEGIAFRLDDPQNYVGAPACVIGGGTSAAEAVIAISNAKTAAEDPTAIYWSYRGDRLPRVSKALAEVFFEAYVGNGNIRYYPKSEPAAIITGEDHEEYLAIRIDRRNMAGRPHETTHLEFPKASCVACIGEDVPEGLLGAIGIPLIEGGPRMKKRLVVNRYLETRQPNVFLVGDLLSQSYLQTDDFDADPAGFSEIRHRGNIKSALRDGVLVAEVINLRKQGKTDIDIQVEDAEEIVPATEPPATAATPSGPSQKAVETGARIYHILPSGVVESEHTIAKTGETTIGRQGTDIVFNDDPLLAETHASLVRTPTGYQLRDRGGDTGTFFRVPPATKLKIGEGDLLRVGRQFLLVVVKDRSYAVTHYDRRGREQGTHSLTGKPIILGRDAPNVILDSQDPSLSRRHLALAARDGCVLVKDLKSANNTYLRIQGSIDLKDGDQFQIGSKLFIFSEGDGPFPEVETSRSRADEKGPETGEVTQAGPVITFEGLGKTIRAGEGQTICEAAEANGIPINAECHVGICGSDPIEILKGAENLAAPPDDGESETLEDLCNLEPGKCRLACKARIKGPVTVRIINPS